METFTCPLCEQNSTKRIDQNSGWEQHYTPIWVCSECPFIGMEFYGEHDLEAITRYLNK